VATDIIAFVVFCRLRHRLTLRGLSGILALRGTEVSYNQAAKQVDGRDRDAKLLPITGDELRKRRHGSRRGLGISWNVEETYLKVSGR